jgi:FG-GAP-like repeat
LNQLTNPYSPAGTNQSPKIGVIASGAGPSKSVYLADMKGDGLADYLVVNPNTGSIHVWWNFGPNPKWENGWQFEDGGELANGVPHANWATLRFPDINGDGRADYVYIGAGGSLGHWLNTGSKGGKDVIFVAQGGIASGAATDLSTLIFADVSCLSKFALSITYQLTLI